MSENNCQRGGEESRGEKNGEEFFGTLAVSTLTGSRPAPITTPICFHLLSLIASYHHTQSSHTLTHTHTHTHTHTESLTHSMKYRLARLLCLLKEKFTVSFFIFNNHCHVVSKQISKSVHFCHTSYPATVMHRYMQPTSLRHATMQCEATVSESEPGAAS